MSGLTDRLERDLREIAAGAHPSPSAWESIAARLGDDTESEVVLELSPVPDGSKRVAWILVAAAVLVVIIGLVAVFGTGAGDDHVIPAGPDATTTFVSPRNGFSIRYLDRGEGTITPATQLWGFSTRPDDGFDVVETGLAAVFKGTSTQIPVNTFSTDDWIDQYASKDENMMPGTCGVPRRQQAEITIDGQPGRISECANRIEATVVAGARLYYFTLLHTRSDARAVFDAFAATIHLTPETAVDVPALNSTFVSPTNGFSFKYLDRGGLTPATRLWDPATQPGDEVDESGFDVVETGLAAYLKGASTKIPDGVPIDRWVDEHVSPGGCDTPRSEQEAITIDGHVGRMTKCLNRIEATVVAGGRLYYFVLLADRSDASAFFDTWVETIHLTPETAAVR